MYVCTKVSVRDINTIYCLVLIVFNMLGDSGGGGSLCIFSVLLRWANTIKVWVNAVKMPDQQSKWSKLK